MEGEIEEMKLEPKVMQIVSYEVEESQEGRRVLRLVHSCSPD